MEGTTTYGDINQRTAAWAATEALSHAEPVIVLNKFGQMKPIPKNKADSVKFRRPVPFSPITVPLQEGVTPTAQRMSYEDVPAQLKQYGKPIEITDKVIDTSEDPVLRDSMMLAGEQAGASIEAVTWGVIRAGLSVFRANGSLRSSINTPVSLNKLRAVVRFLKAQKGLKITQVLDSSPKFSTFSVEAAYIAFCHTNVESDLRNVPGFKPVADYGSRQTVSPQEIGTIEEIRFVSSPDLSAFPDEGGAKSGSGTEMVSTSGVNADVYPIVVIAREAYGCVPLKGAGAITPMVVNPKPSAADPMAQRGYVSWKTYFTAVILNELWIARLEVAATYL